jgi:microcystin degradation protein MlrC
VSWRKFWYSYKTYPHIDLRETAYHAGTLLHRMMTGEIQPQTLRVHLPMLEEANGGRTDVGAMVERIARARAYEKGTARRVCRQHQRRVSRGQILPKSAPLSSSPMRATPPPHKAFAESLADDIWAKRNDVMNVFHTVDAVAEIARTYAKADGPLIVADYADNPGGGSYGRFHQSPARASGRRCQRRGLWSDGRPASIGSACR